MDSKAVQSMHKGNHGFLLRDSAFEEHVKQFTSERVIAGRGQDPEKAGYDHIQGKYAEIFVYRTMPGEFIKPPDLVIRDGGDGWDDLESIYGDPVSIKSCARNYISNLSENPFAQQTADISWVFQDSDPMSEGRFFGVYMRFTEHLVEAVTMVDMPIADVKTRLKPMKKKSLVTKKALYYFDCRVKS